MLMKSLFKKGIILSSVVVSFMLPATVCANTLNKPYKIVSSFSVPLNSLTTGQYYTISCPLSLGNTTFNQYPELLITFEISNGLPEKLAASYLQLGSQWVGSLNTTKTVNIGIVGQANKLIAHSVYISNKQMQLMVSLGQTIRGKNNYIRLGGCTATEVTGPIYPISPN